jgi:hypothetical protein
MADALILIGGYVARRMMFLEYSILKEALVSRVLPFDTALLT